MSSSSEEPIDLEGAHRLHLAGELERAEAAYRRLVAQNPSDVGALHLLGLLLYQQGRMEEGLGVIEQSVGLSPGSAMMQFNWANALLGAQKLDEAVTAYRRAVELQPDFPEALMNLSVALSRRGDFADAAVVARLMIARRQTSLEGHFNLAMALRGQGEVAYRKGQFAEAADFFRQAVAILPHHLESNLGLAKSLAALKDPRAHDVLENLCKQKDVAPAAVYALAQWLDRAGRRGEAIEQFRRVIAMDPNHAAAHADLAACCAEMGMHAEAIEAARRSLEIEPGNAAAAANLGAALSLVGRHEEATIILAKFARQAEDWSASAGGDAQTVATSAEPMSNYLLLQHYREPYDPGAVFFAHLEFGRRFDRPDPTPPTTDPARGRRLRIGYVSGDFRTHSVAFFLEPILERHDRAAVEVFLYSTRGGGDAVTNRLRKLDVQWRDISALSDDAALKMIRADQIDILVDLSGHTGGSRLPLFGRKPAPVQATYLGYPNTTGLRAIDYKITDSWADPVQTAGAFYVEQLVRLGRPAWCYRPPAGAPDVAAAPVEKNKYITFGCFNAARKISAAAARLWGRLLEAVPDSRLILKSRELADTGARERILNKLLDAGIPEDRLELRAGEPTIEAHLAAYADVDIALDPFPYHGTTTTCDALYMGVPVVSVAGRTHVSRVGVSLLTAVGLTDLIAKSQQQYVQIARQMAGDRRRLIELRSTLRQRMLRSPLCDEESMARAMEEAYRQMWEHHLAKPAAAPASSPVGDSKQALALAVRKSLSVAMSGLILSRHLAEDFDPAAVFELERAFGREFDRATQRDFDLSPRKRLRIGYVSPDFRRHAVASFFEPLLASRDRERFEVICYSNVATPDAHTERFRAQADAWRVITHAPDPEAAQMILEDRIDILVDLAGHSADNRLPLLGLGVAPVQVTYLGFPSSSGMSTVHYRVSDALADPEGNERWHSEKLERLPNAFYCYRAHDEAPGVSALPAREKGYVTFGSLNTFAKITPAMLLNWAGVLARTAKSRLLVVAPAEAEASIRKAMSGAGIAEDRVELTARLTLANYYELYRRIDVALDTFPYNGHTTTCDCLWMGIPVVNLAGVAAVSRAGMSVLTNVGLKELIAESHEQYVATAAALAGDIERLAQLRGSLRERMAGSKIMNAGLIARDLEAAYQRMWEQTLLSRTE